ncbi:MAG: ribonuclease E/G, partial [Gemmatimonadales bacterium]
MKREILINGGQRETRVAILEDDRLVELLVDRQDHSRIVGNIYKGKVEAVIPGIQAAFVDIGLEKSAFLHASDLLEPDEDDDLDEPDAGTAAEAPSEVAPESPEDGQEETRLRRGRRSRRRSRGRVGSDKPREKEEVEKPANGASRSNGSRRQLPNIQDVLKKGQTLLVQVTKEPISTKGCRVTAQISLAGRFLVYMPGASRVGISRKIENREQRSRLREMVSGMMNGNSGGLIVRTVAEGVTETHFKREIDSLLNIWKKITRKDRFARTPSLVHRETSLIRGLIRDVFSAKVDALHVDSKAVYEEVRQYLEPLDPELMERVHLYHGKT